MQLLWVENHAGFVRSAGKAFLTAHSVTVVASVAAAKVALSEKRFDAVLLDYDLEDGKGTSLIPTLLALPAPPAVIATSSHDSGNQALVAAGAGAVCSKMRFAEIETILSRVVRPLPPD
jgi:DNA-binding NarL/FixJ family response regulator